MNIYTISKKCIGRCKKAELKKWCEEHRADLQGADLRRANLQGADLYRADLQGADLRRANLQGADLYSADLRGADLQGANLYSADLRRADLQGANLQGADLQGANLQGADLQGADLYSADLRGADLDFSCLSLSCRSLRMITDEKQRTQIMYHWASLVISGKDATQEERDIYNTITNYANKMHREDVERLQPIKEEK